MSQFEPEWIIFAREKVVIEEIKKNPDLHHNALIKKIVPKHMAKATFEKIRNNLIEKNVISCLVRGNKKYYNITENYQKKSLQLTERLTNLNFQYLHHEIKRLSDNYSHKDENERISKCIQLLTELLHTDNAFTVLDSIKNPKKTLYKDEHLEIQEMISSIFQIITENKDSENIFPIIMSCIEFDFTKSFDKFK